MKKWKIHLFWICTSGTYIHCTQQFLNLYRLFKDCRKRMNISAHWILVQGGISKSPVVARVVTLIIFYSLNFWPNLINDIFLESGKWDLAIGTIKNGLRMNHKGLCDWLKNPYNSSSYFPIVIDRNAIFTVLVPVCHIKQF